MVTKRPEVLLLVGMSGAGRSASSNVFEDLGYYVIENLPPDLEIGRASCRERV